VSGEKKVILAGDSLQNDKRTTQTIGNTIEPRIAAVEGVKLYYLTAGRGLAVILLHGYTQTSRMWRPTIPLLAEKLTVIAPDLPGIGDSEIPVNGLDMQSAALRIHSLAKSLGVEKPEWLDTTLVLWLLMPTRLSSLPKRRS
jgi:pimeloyl-ACP methyl ester carboxylesterase